MRKIRYMKKKGYISKPQYLKIFADSFFYSIFGFIISKVVQFIIKVIIARNLSVSNFGLLNLILSVFSTLMVLSTLGIPVGITRFISYYLAKNNINKINTIISSAFIIIFPISLLVSLGLYLNSELISVTLKEESLSIYLKYISLALPFAVFILSAKSIISSYLKVRYIFFLNSFEIISRLFFIFILILLGYGMSGVIFGYSFSYFLTFLFALFLLRKLISIKKIDLSFFRKLFNYSWPISLSDIITTFSKSTDIILISFFIGSYSIGTYSSSMAISSQLLLFPQLLLSFFFPIISHLYGSGKNYLKAYRLISYWLFILLLPLLLFIFFNGQDLIFLIFGKSYIISNLVLVFLSIGNFINALIIVAGRQILDMLKYTKENLLLTIIRVITIITFGYVFVPLLGNVGASIAFAVSLFIESIFCLVFIKKRVKIFVFDNLRFLKVFLVFLLPSLTFIVTNNLFKEYSLIKILINSVLFFTLCFISYLIFLYNGEDKTFLKKILLKLKNNEADNF